MKRIMIIVWKKEFKPQLADEIVCEGYIYKLFDVEKSSENKLIYIGKKDENGKGNLKEQISKLIREKLTKDEKSYYLLLLHGGEGICYEKDDIKNIIQKKDNIEGYLFRGGPLAKEPIYYNSTDNTSGLIDADPPEIFPDALNEKGKIKKENFDHVWNYYTKKKLDDLYHIFSLKALTCLGILECIEEKNYENAKKYFSQAWNKNTFKNILKEINSEKEVVRRVLEIDLESIDEKSMAKELKKKIELLKPQYYKALAIDNIEKKGFSFILKHYLNWFGNFSDVLKKYR